MVMKRVYDSRDITDEDWKALYQNDWDEVKHIVTSQDNINIPDINIAELKSYPKIYLCGGGQDECLSEFQLILDAFNIKYTLIKSLIY